MNPNDMTTRRVFLHRGLTLVGASATVPLFLERSALAVAPERGARTKSRPGMPDDHILVVVQLAGGNDGLNTVIPVGNDIYYKSRPQIGIQGKDALKLDDNFALHPALTGFKSLYDDGLLAIVHGVGYPNPNRSHFKSTDIWQTGSPEGRIHNGWIGRYFDSCCKGEDKPEPQSGIALTSEVPLAMRGDKFAPVAFRRPDDLTWNSPSAPMSKRPRGETTSMSNTAFAKLNEPTGNRPTVSELDYLQRTALDARLSAADIQKTAAGASAVTYPISPLSQSFRTVARMIAAHMPTKIYYVAQGGYDTHTNQKNRQQQQLSQLGGALKAFVDDLKATKQLDRVTIMTFSEFGRRVGENASGGTDHGAAAPMFIMGNMINAGLHGVAPSLEKLDHGDLIYTTDFRSVYGAMLKNWLGADSAKLLGPIGASPLPIFKRA